MVSRDPLSLVEVILHVVLRDGVGLGVFPETDLYEPFDSGDLGVHGDPGDDDGEVRGVGDVDWGILGSPDF